MATQPTHLFTVLIADRRGIVAAITDVLAGFDIGLLELTQTVLSGYFTITFSAVIPPGGPLDQAVAELVRTRLGNRAAVTVVPFERERLPADPPAEAEDRYILTAVGEPGTAILQELAALVADRGGNFVDFGLQRTSVGVSVVAEIDLPAASQLDQLQVDLQHVGAAAGLQVRLQHQRLFTATNEIAFRRVGA